jgi:WD40 repeat protein
MKSDVTQESEDRGSPPPIPHHQLLRRIGRGSYGEVWIALDAMGKWCAVKIVWRDDADSGRAYEQEFRGLKRYDDLVGNEAHLLPIRNVGRDPGGAFFYYAMELADDATTRQPLPRPRSQETLAPETLALVRRYRPWTLAEQLRQQGRLPQAECLEYGIALSSALEVIHGGRLVHRDVKPSNIIFVNGRPKLADVGLVTAIDATLLSQVGTSGFVPLYGAGTESGDLFALGKVIYLMATGKAIYEFPAEAADLGQLSGEERRGLAELRAVYDRACDVMPDDRYESAKALRDDLDLLRRNESVIQLRELQDSEGRLLEQARKQQRRLRLLALATIASVLLSAVAWWLAGLNTRVARQAVLAELDVRQLLRMRDRTEGWAQEDWNRALRAASLGLDDEDVWRHAVATLSGLEAHQLGYWRNVEATSAAFAEDGRIVLAGHGQNTGAVINGLTNRSTLPVRGEGKVAWTRTGAAWLLQAEAHACVVRDAHSGSVIQSLPLRPGEATRVLEGPVLALSPDGALASASLTAEGRSGRTVLWRVEDGEVLGERVGAASALTFSPDGTLLATGHDRGTVQVFSTSPLALEATLGPGSPPNPITALAFGRNARLPREGRPTPQPWVLAAADSGVRITVWDLASKVPLAFCLGSTWSIQSLAFHPDGQILASAGRNGVTLWDAASGLAQLRLDRACGGDTRALAFDRSGSMLVGGSTAQSQYADVSVWKLEPNRGIRRFRGLTAYVRKVAFSPDASSIAALSDEWVVGVWDCESERLRALIEVPPGILADNAAIAFGPDGIGSRLRRTDPPGFTTWPPDACSKTGACPRAPVISCVSNRTAASPSSAWKRARRSTAGALTNYPRRLNHVSGSSTATRIILWIRTMSPPRARGFSAWAGTRTRCGTCC